MGLVVVWCDKDGGVIGVMLIRFDRGCSGVV